jgi:predicted amidohydrolase
VAPNGSSVFRAPTHDEGLYVVAIDPAELRRERIASPLLRDERPEAVLRQLDQILAERLQSDTRSARRP